MGDEKRSGGEWVWIVGLGLLVAFVGAAVLGAFVWFRLAAAPTPPPGGRAASVGGALELDCKLVDFTRDSAGRGRIKLALTPEPGAVEWTELGLGDAKVYSAGDGHSTVVTGRATGTPLPQSSAGPFALELETDALPAEWTRPTLKLVLRARRDSMASKGSYEWFQIVPLYAQEGTDGATPPAIPGAATETARPR